MKTWTLFVLAAALWPGPARADQYLLRQWLSLQFYQGTLPKTLAVDCYLGRDDLSGLRPGQGDLWARVSGVTSTVVRPKATGGYVEAKLAYDCNGACPRRFYACFVASPEATGLSASSVTRVTGEVGAGSVGAASGGLGPRRCEGKVSDQALNPDRSPCAAQCECSNRNFVGVCRAGRCATLPRATCERSGQRRECIDPFRRCAGEQVCSPWYLPGHWGDCQCP